jgi:hypothetical protein
MLADSGAANPTSEKRCLQCSTARSYNSTRRPTLSCALTTSLRASASLGRRYLQGTRCRIVHQSGTQILTWQGFGAGRTTNHRRMPLTDQTSGFISFRAVVGLQEFGCSDRCPKYRPEVNCELVEIPGTHTVCGAPSVHLHQILCRRKTSTVRVSASAVCAT